jgi:hypothetical protein
MKALVIDFGGIHATCGLVEDRVLLARRRRLIQIVRKSIQVVLPRIRDACRELMHGRGPASRDITGVSHRVCRTD